MKRKKAKRFCYCICLLWATTRWLRAKHRLAQLIIAAPVASKQAIELTKKEGKNVADKNVVLLLPN
jgi:predicted phosphoribosyltransferase